MDVAVDRRGSAGAIVGRVAPDNQAFDGMYDHAANAFRIPPRNPDALADAIIAMHHADLSAMGRICLDRARQYGWPAAAARYLDLFQRLLANP